jgi:hypothetical protein
MIELKIERSKGKGMMGKMSAYIRPDYYCFNKARKADGWNNQELQESINNILRKWYQPELFAYEIDGETIVSNNEKNALTEYWRVCERTKIGQMFTVTLINGQ